MVVAAGGGWPQVLLAALKCAYIWPQPPARPQPTLAAAPLTLGEGGQR